MVCPATYVQTGLVCLQKENADHSNVHLCLSKQMYECWSNNKTTSWSFQAFICQAGAASPPNRHEPALTTLGSGICGLAAMTAAGVTPCAKATLNIVSPSAEIHNQHLRLDTDTIYLQNFRLCRRRSRLGACLPASAISRHSLQEGGAAHNPSINVGETHGLQGSPCST